MAIRARYKGTGEGNARPFIVVGERALPARDLTDEEFARLTDDERAAVEASPLYTMQSTRAARAEKADEPDAEPVTFEPAPALEQAVKDGEA